MLSVVCYICLPKAVVRSFLLLSPYRANEKSHFKVNWTNVLSKIGTIKTKFFGALSDMGATNVFQTSVKVMMTSRFTL